MTTGAGWMGGAETRGGGGVCRGGGGGAAPASGGRSVSILRRGGGRAGAASSARRPTIPCAWETRARWSRRERARPAARPGTAQSTPAAAARWTCARRRTARARRWTRARAPGPRRVSARRRGSTCFARMARWSSRSVRKTRRCPPGVCTIHLSLPAAGASAPRTLNWCPQFVQRTVVPRPLTRASSNSYSVLHRSHWTSIRHSRLRACEGPDAAERRKPWKRRPSEGLHVNTGLPRLSIRRAREAPTGPSCGAGSRRSQPRPSSARVGQSDPSCPQPRAGATRRDRDAKAAPDVNERAQRQDAGAAIFAAPACARPGARALLPFLPVGLGLRVPEVVRS